MLVKVDAITVSERQRKSFNKELIIELAESIHSKGLLHPIVICEQRTQGTIIPRLVAGERRLRAVKLLHSENKTFFHNGEAVLHGCIPFTRIEDSDELKIRETELEENLRRVDLSWQERVNALDELHTLRCAQNPAQTPKDTAKEIMEPAGIGLQGALNRVHRAVLIADNMDDPNVMKAKDETQAYNYLLRNMENELLSELAKRNLSSIRTHTIIHGDAVGEMGKLQKKFGLVVVDPPYGIGADTFGNAANNAHTYSDTEDAALELAENILFHAFQVTLDNAHLYMFCDIDHFKTLKHIAAKAGWKPWRTPIVWHKTLSSAHAPAHEYGFRRNFELIMFCTKGSKPFSQVYSDVISCDQEQNKVHAAQKPADLYATLIKRSLAEGGDVLDPCAGSGTIFKGAELAGCRGTGIELEEKFYNHCLVAIDQLKANPLEEF